MRDAIESISHCQYNAFARALGSTAQLYELSGDFFPKIRSARNFFLISKHQPPIFPEQLGKDQTENLFSHQKMTWLVPCSR